MGLLSMHWRATAMAIGLGVLLAGAAQAADPASVMGKWIERLPNGRGMVTEIAPHSISYYPVDQAGTAQGAPSQSAVTYKDLGGDLVGVDFAGADGSGIMLQRTGANSLTMDFPGVGAHKLTRIGDQAPGRRAGDASASP